MDFYVFSWLPISFDNFVTFITTINKILYLISLVCFPIVIPLSDSGKKSVILDIIKVQGEGGEGGSLLDGLLLQLVRDLVLGPVRETLTEKATNSRLPLAFPSLCRLQAQLRNQINCHNPNSTTITLTTGSWPAVENLRNWPWNKPTPAARESKQG